MSLWRWTWLVLAILAAICLALALAIALYGRAELAPLLLLPGLGLCVLSLILFQMNDAFDRKALALYEAEEADSDSADA